VTLVAERPAATEPRDWRFPAFERRHRVIACHVPGRPLAVASLVLDAGASTEPAGREGIGRLLARALTQGTTSRDATAFAIAAERLGADIDVDVEWDSMRGHVDAPVDRFADAVALLVEAVRTPALDSDALGRLRAERLDELIIEASQPAGRGSTELARQVFSAGSRYSRPAGGDVAGVTAATDDDIRALCAARIGPASAHLVIVGDLEQIDVAELEAVVFGGWLGEAPLPLPVDVTARSDGRRIVIVDRPGSVQSILLAGHEAPGRDIPDYVATTTMSMVLGGMFTSRLNLKLREEKGYTYGAFGGFDLRKDAGTFLARAAVQADSTAPALLDLVAEIERTARDGVTQAERDDAVAYRSGVFPVNFAGVHSVAHALGDLVVHGWSDDHFDALRAEIMSIETAQLSEAAAERLHPDELVMVVVGDAATIEAPLTATGLGPVTVVADPG
jgi:predicted Zn-dependent peptidase